MRMVTVRFGEPVDPRAVELHAWENIPIQAIADALREKVSRLATDYNES
jgi:hypothetical protein